MELHPSIAFRGTEGSRRAWVPGTALDVCEIVAGYEEMGSQRFLEETGISEDRLDAALAYHRAHQDEVDQRIQENARPLRYWREHYPGLNIRTIDNRPEAGSPRVS